MNYELNLENVRLRSLVEATETDLFDQKKRRRRLEQENAALKKENKNLSISIQGVTGAKVNLNNAYQELEGLYERLEKKFKAADECCTEREITILAQIKEIEKLQEQIEGFGKVGK